MRGETPDRACRAGRTGRLDNPMGLLREETCLYPVNLLTDYRPDPERAWQVIYTKARQEKALARQLAQDEVPFYLPTVERRYEIRGRRMKSHNPLFPGYVFTYVNEDERQRCFWSTKRISSIIDVIDEEQLVRDLTNIQLLIESGVPLAVEDRLETGDAVRVTRGPLMGLEGQVVRRRRNSVLLVAVSFLQQGVSLQIEDFMLEPI